MSSLFGKVLNLVGWEEDEYEEDQELETDTEEDNIMDFNQKANRSRVNKNTPNFQSSTNMKLIVSQPQSFEEARSICDCLKNKKPVIVNLDSLEKVLAQRIVDFMSGSIYSLNGTIQKVANNIFVIAPSNVNIDRQTEQEFEHNELSVDFENTVEETVEEATGSWLD